MNYKSNTIIQDSFQEFLRTSNCYNGKNARLIIAFVDTELLAFIQKYINADLVSVYDERDSTVIEQWYKTVLSYPFLQKLDMACKSIKFSETLNWYKRFLLSEYNPEVIAIKEAEMERIKQERKDLRKKNRGQEPRVTSTPDNHETGKLVIAKKIKKQELDENQREGAITQVSITRRERNPKFRQACLDKYGYVCQCCGMDFEKVYGEIGKEFIEVHHLFPISQTEGEHELNPEEDLVPLCSNCHSMIHRLDGEEMTLEKLKSYYHGYNYAEEKKS